MSTENQKSDSRKLKIMDYVRELETKGDIKNSSIETGKSIVTTGIGLLAGAFIGRPSLLIGIGTTFAGYYTETPKLTQLGVGLMTTGGYQLYQKGFGNAEVNGVEGFKENAKNIKASLKHSLYLDKIFKPKKEKEQGTQGLDEGETQYFKYPLNDGGTGSLEAIEQAIHESGERYSERQMNGGRDEYFSGIEERLY